jgi:hypothetical protein
MTDSPVPGSGDAAIAAAAARAEETRHRNLPQFDDLPIPADTANLREGPELNGALLALLPLVGVWRGSGEVAYPTIGGPFKFGQQITFAHDGRPFLSYDSRTWILDDDGNVVLVGRTASAKEVNAAKRLYGLVNNGDLAYVEERAMVGRPMTPHTSAVLKRIVG